MFRRGEETLTTLINLVRGFRRMRTSFLHAAMITDIDLYESTVDLPEGEPALPEHIDETSEVALLRTISEQLQALSHYASKQSGRPKIKRLARPQTAKDVFMRRDAVKQFTALESKFKFVTNDEYADSVRRRQEDEGGSGGADVHSG